MQRVSFMMTISLPDEMDPMQFAGALEKDLDDGYREFFPVDVNIDGAFVHDN